MLKEDILKSIEPIYPRLEKLGHDLQKFLNQILTGARIQFQQVDWRLKAPQSLAQKLSRPDKTYQSPWDVTDLVGLRVTTYFEDAIEDVARLIETHFLVDLRHSTDKLRFSDVGRFGYRSLHYVCAPPPEQAPHPDFRFEIQIRTVLQHAWAEIEHDLGYKAQDEVPDPIRRRFSRIASLLEIADQEFVSIRRDLQSYHAAVRAELSQGRVLPLDVLSLAEITASPQVSALDTVVAEYLHKPLLPEPFFPSYLARALRLAELKTTDAVLNAAALYGPQLSSFLPPYFDFAQQTLGLEAHRLEGIKRGNALLFVGHLAILRGPERILSKMAQLTRFYAALDYSGDETRAQAVAARQLACLGTP